MSSTSARSFNGSAQWFNRADHAALSVGDARLCLVAWVRPGAITDYLSAVDKRDGTGAATGIEYLFRQDDVGHLQWIVGDGTNLGVVTSTEVMLADTWYLAVGYHDPTANEISLSLTKKGDARAAFETPIAWTTGILDGTAGLSIGQPGDFASATYRWNGSVAAVGVCKPSTGVMATLAGAIADSVLNSGNGKVYSDLTAQERTDWGVSAWYDLDEPNATDNAVESVGGLTATANGDPGVAAGPSVASITVTSPVQYQTFQRDTSDEADIVITGTYSGTPTEIEASFNGGAYATIDDSPAGGTFSASLTGQAAGQGTLTVRFTDDTDVNDTVADVGIGDIFIVAGQSNALGEGTNPQTYSHATLKATMYDEANSWRELADPNDGTHTVGNGSCWPLVATLLMADTGLPVAFLVTAVEGSGLVNPTDWQDNGDDYEACVTAATNSGINSARAILWYQGESDVINGSVSAVQYAAALSAMLDDLQTDLTMPTLRLLAANLATLSFVGSTRAKLDAIRDGIADAIIADADILSGPVLCDLDTSGGDGAHLKTDVHMQTLANRWWRAIDAAFFGATLGGPQARKKGIYFSGDEVYVTWQSGRRPWTGGTDTTGWSVTDNGGARTVSSASGTNTITLVCDQALVAPVTVGFASFNDAAAATLLDTGTYPSPPESFTGEAATAGNPPSRSSMFRLLIP